MTGNKVVVPSKNTLAFDCPHCGTLTTQFWSEVAVTNSRRENAPVRTYDASFIVRVRNMPVSAGFSEATKKSLSELADLGAASLLRVSPYKVDGAIVSSLNVTECYHCKEIAIWIDGKMIFPDAVQYPPAHKDMPADVVGDYNEAGQILKYSPRGAAALLRLTLQKLCPLVGGTGQSIDENIKSLVAKGLDERIKKMLDAVRVIGNEAVHPGTMDLKDDTGTAVTLFRLINLIVEKLITEPKMVDELYASLPPEKLKGIETRDAHAKKASQTTEHS